MARGKSTKALLEDLEADELRELLLEVCKLSAKNEHFLRLQLQDSGTADPRLVLEEAQKKVHACFYGCSSFPKLDLRGARGVVVEYAKVLKGYPLSAAKLKLYYVEVGTSLTEEYGDIDEGFYTSLETMLRSFCEEVAKQPSWHSHFMERLTSLRSRASRIGWGYGDEVRHLVSELEEQVQGRNIAGGS